MNTILTSIISVGGIIIALIVGYFTVLMPMSKDLGAVAEKLISQSEQIVRLEGQITQLEARLTTQIEATETEIKKAVKSHVHGPEDTIFFKDISSAERQITTLIPISQEEGELSFTVPDLQPCTEYELQVSLKPDFSDAKTVKFKTLCGPVEHPEDRIFTVQLPESP